MGYIVVFMDRVDVIRMIIWLEIDGYVMVFLVEYDVFDFMCCIEEVVWG